MATFTRTFPVGDTLVGPAGISDNLSTLELRFTNWPNTNTLAAAADISLDGGTNWLRVVALNPFPGNRPVGKDGTADSSVRIGPMPAGTSRQARVTVTCAGGPVTTTVTVQVV